MPALPEIPNRIAFTAAAFEGGLVAVAMLLGLVFGLPPLRTFQFDLYGVGVGVVAALPPLVLFWLCMKLPFQPLKTIVKLLDETIVPLFRECEFPQLVIIAMLAGVGEEMLFRGIVQAAATEWIGGAYGEWVGLAVAAALFGFLHLVTPTYALLAAVIGFYLGWIWLVAGNLLVPIVVHAVYDLVALIYLVRIRRVEGGA